MKSTLFSAKLSNRCRLFVRQHSSAGRQHTSSYFTRPLSSVAVLRESARMVLLTDPFQQAPFKQASHPSAVSRHSLPSVTLPFCRSITGRYLISAPSAAATPFNLHRLLQQLCCVTKLLQQYLSLMCLVAC